MKNKFITFVYLFLLLTPYGCVTTTPIQNIQKAIETNNTELAKSAIAAGANSSLALISAIQQNSLNMAEFFLNYGASPVYREESYAINEAYLVDLETKKEFQISITESNGNVVVQEAYPEIEKDVANVLNSHMFYFKSVVSG